MKNVKPISIEHPSRILFLRAFIQEIINQKTKEINPEQNITNITINKEVKTIPPKVQVQKQISSQIPQRPIIPHRAIMPPRPIQRITPSLSFPQNQVGNPSTNPGTKEIQGTPVIPVINPKADIKEEMSSIGLERITPILLDPSVMSVECPGPDKPLLVNQHGVIHATNIILRSEDIDNVMKEISEKTRIPLMSGVFKAALGNVIITALISEFLGTKFVIQKTSKSPQGI